MTIVKNKLTTSRHVHSNTTNKWCTPTALFVHHQQHRYKTGPHGRHWIAPIPRRTGLATLAGKPGIALEQLDTRACTHRKTGIASVLQFDTRELIGFHRPHWAHLSWVVLLKSIALPNANPRLPRCQSLSPPTYACTCSVSNPPHPTPPCFAIANEYLHSTPFYLIPLAFAKHVHATWGMRRECNYKN